MAEFRATIAGVQGKPGTATNPRNGAVVKLLTFQIEAGQELLAWQGHDCVVSIIPMDQQIPFDQAEQPVEANGTEPAPIERRRQRRARREAGTNEVAEAAAGP